MDTTQNPTEHGEFNYERNGETIQLKVAGISIAELALVATGLMLALPKNVRVMAMLDMVQRIDNPQSDMDIADHIATSIGGGIRDGSAIHRVDESGQIIPNTRSASC